MIAVRRMPAMNRAFRVGMMLLTAVAGTLASSGPATAEEAQSGHADLARRLAEDVVAGQGAEHLDAWSRSVIERALERAAAPTGVPTTAPEGTPLPRSRDAVAVVPKGAATAEVLVFTSLAVPAASWRAAARDGAPDRRPAGAPRGGGGEPPGDSPADRHPPGRR